MRTYLEMTSPDDLVPVISVPGVTPVPIEPTEARELLPQYIGQRRCGPSGRWLRSPRFRTLLLVQYLHECDVRHGQHEGAGDDPG